MAERAVIKIDALTGDAKEEVEDLEGKLKGATLQAEGLDSALDLDANTVAASASVADIESASEAAQDEVQALQRSLARVGSTDAEANVDVDRDRDRRGGGLPGELDEVGEAARFVGSLPPQIQGLLAGATAAAAALGTAGGLAAVATNLASKFGSAGLQEDVEGIQTRFKGVAATISDEFAPVIRGQVIPAAEGLADFTEDAADELASFTSAVLNATTGLEQEGVSDEQRDTGRFSGPTRTVSGTRLGSGQPDFEASMEPQESMAREMGVDRATQSEITAQQRTTRRETVAPILAQIRAARERIATDPTFGRQEGLQQILKLRTQLNSKLQVAQEKAGSLRFAFQGFINENLKGLGQFNDSLKELQNRVQRLKQESGLNRAPFSQAIKNISRGRAVQGAGLAANATSRTRGRQQGLSGIAQQATGLAGSNRELGKTQQNVKKTKQSVKGLGDTLSRQVGQAGVQAFSALGSVIAGAKNQAQSFQDIASKLLSGVGSTLLKAALSGGASAGLGILGGVSTILGGAFASGTDSAPGGISLVGERGPELVNLPQGSQVASNSETQDMLGMGRVVQKLDDVAARVDRQTESLVPAVQEGMRMDPFEAAARTDQARRLERESGLDRVT